MRKIFIAVLCLASLYSHSQIKIGAEAGYNSSSFTNPDGNNTISLSSISSFHAGAVLDLSLDSHFFVNTGVFAEGKGASQSPTNFALGGAATTTRLLYLQIPANIGYSFNLKNGLHLFLGTGLYYAVGLSGTEKGTTTYVTTTTTTTASVDRRARFTNTPNYDASVFVVRPTEFGYNLFVGVRWNDWELKGNFSKGFATVFPTQDIKLHNQVVGVSLAYYLWKSKK
jgi:hypothetical protein